MIKAICFDVVGTLIDWRGTITSKLVGVTGYADKIAHEWVYYYAEGDFKSLKQLQQKGEELLRKYIPESELEYIDVPHLSRVWQYMQPWVSGRKTLNTLVYDYPLAALTNLSEEVLARITRHAYLDFDYLLSAEYVGVKKPDPKVYQLGIDTLLCKPEEVLMVAAHTFDLEGAKKAGMKTCYVERNDDKEAKDLDRFDISITSLTQLPEAIKRFEEKK